ncbi:MAG: hypothetical protein HZA90_12110 [Verrucomicrobia bacterium]|nr:hypothetical protein [Verrucomicrobiota bacterium]
MANTDQNRSWTRRQFLRGAGIFGVGSAVGTLAGRTSRAAGAKAGAPSAAPQAYDVEKFKKVDPKLIHYEPAGGIRPPQAEPNRIAFGPDEMLWVTSGKHVTALDQQGAKAVEFSVGEVVRALAVAQDGSVWIALRDHIEVFNTQGKRANKWDPPAKKAWLTSLAVGEKDVFASDAGNRAVYRFDRAGKLLGRLGDKDAARKVPAWLVPSPYFDLEIGGDGLLWVVNPGQHQFQAFTFDGTLEKTWGEASFGIAGFCGCCNPSYFTRLADGRFVTSEKGLPRVKVYSTAGQFESVVAGPASFPKYMENMNSNPIPMDIAADRAGRIYVADTLGNQIRIYQRKS